MMIFLRTGVKSRGPIGTGTTSKDFGEGRDRLEEGSRKNVDGGKGVGQRQGR